MISFEETPSKPNAAGVSAAIKTDDSAIVRRGLIFVFGFLGLFLIWGTLFPISSAVIAAGHLVSSGQNKLIQHSSGGIVRSIEANDGEQLEKGDVIAVLDDAEARARLTRLEARHQRLAALKTRLLAEKSDSKGDNGKSFTLSETSLRGFARNTVHALSKDTVASVFQDEQRTELKFGRNRRLAELTSARARLEALRAKGSGLHDRLVNRTEAANRTRQRVAKVRPLAGQGYVARSKLWDMETLLAEQNAAIDDLLSEIEVLRQQLAEGEADLRRMLSGNREQISKELTQTLGELAEISDQIGAARNEVRLSVIRAPASGTLTNLQANTVGGVVPAGSAIAAIVPAGARLIAEAKVPPKDVDSVHPGQDARIALSAFSQRIVDPIPAKVAYVSADAIPDETTGEAAFTVRVAFDRNSLPADLSDTLQSGMPVDVYIQSQPRVFLSYVLRPLLHSVSRSFREPN
ncbi:MAG: HlyD family type I secretion periplasmic adaptor subunit [Rhizobiaceae bacterium]